MIKTGVDYYLVCKNCYEKVSLGGLNSKEDKAVEEIIEKRICEYTFKPDVVKNLVDTWLLDTVISFVKRHKNCKKLRLLNDMLDDLEGIYALPEPDYSKPVNVDENLEKLVKKARKYCPKRYNEEKKQIEMFFFPCYKLPENILKEIRKPIKVSRIVKKVIEELWNGEKVESVIVETEDGNYKCDEYGCEKV